MKPLHYIDKTVEIVIFYLVGRNIDCSEKGRTISGDDYGSLLDGLSEDESTIPSRQFQGV